MKIGEIEIVPYYNEEGNEILSISVIPQKGWRIKGNTSVIEFEKEEN